MQIVKAVPAHVLTHILSAAEPAPEAESVCDGPMRALLWRQIVYLLLLLPPSCHPAVLQARLTDIRLRRALTVPPLPEHAALNDASPTHATLLVQVLSAAAVLAGGQPHRIWSPQIPDPPVPSHPQLSPAGVPVADLQQAYCRRPCSAAMRAESSGGTAPSAPPPVAHKDIAPTVVCAAAADGLTTVTLTLPHASVHTTRGSSLIARAIAQLHHVQHLTIDSTAAPASAPELVAAVQALPALRRLHLIYGSRAPPLSLADACASELLHGLSRVPQLVDLSLECCLRCDSPPAARGGGEQELPRAEQEAVLSLSRLTALTRLGLARTVMSARWAAVFTQAVEALPALQELDVHGIDHVSAEEGELLHGLSKLPRNRFARSRILLKQTSRGGGQRGGGGLHRSWGGGAVGGGGGVLCGPLVMHVCRSTRMLALRSLCAAVKSGSSLDRYCLLLEEGVGCMGAKGGGVLRRVTALNLAGTRCHSADAIAALGRLSGLQSLSLRGGDVHDDCWAALGSALTAMVALTALDISSTRAPLRGVQAALEAAEGRAVDGAGGLRRLAMANVLSQKHIGHRRDTIMAIAQRLGRVRGLEELVLCTDHGSLLGVGLLLVVDALRELPGLQLLDICGHASYGWSSSSVLTTFAGLTSLRRLEVDTQAKWYCRAYDPRIVTSLAVKRAIEAAAPGMTVAMSSSWARGL